MQRQDSNLRFPAYETGRMTTSILCVRNYAETHWLLLVIVFNYLSVAVDQCVLV